MSRVRYSGNYVYYKGKEIIYQNHKYIYPPWWNSTVTIYNRYEDPLTQIVTWYRTVLTDCFWKVNVGVVYGNQSMNASYTNMIICRIPKNDNYVNAYIWKRLSAEERLLNFTLQVGDIIVNGEVDDDINEYIKGQRSSDLIERYKDLGIIRIETTGDNSDEVRNLPHYLASQGV